MCFIIIVYKLNTITICAHNFKHVIMAKGTPFYKTIKLQITVQGPIGQIIIVQLTEQLIFQNYNTDCPRENYRRPIR